MRHLTLAVTISDQGSIIAAAKALHVSQPVVTRGLHDLEAILGVQLFDRGPKGVSPTVYGESFLEHARAVLSQIRQAGRQLEMLANGEQGTVTVGTQLSGSDLVVPRAISALKQGHPHLDVVVHEAAPEALTSALLGGGCDLVVGRLSPTPPSLVRQQMLYREPLQLIAREGHPALEMESPTLSQLSRHLWILPTEQMALRNELEEWFLREQVQLPANRVECSSVLTLHQLLIMAGALAVMPLFMSQGDYRLKVVDIRLTGIHQAVGVSYAATKPLLPAARLMYESMQEQAELIRREVKTGTASWALKRESD